MIPFLAQRALRYLGAFPWNAEEPAMGRFVKLLDEETGAELKFSIDRDYEVPEDVAFGDFVSVGVMVDQEPAVSNRDGRARATSGFKTRLRLVHCVKGATPSRKAA